MPVDEQQLRSLIAAALHVDGGPDNLQPFWADIIPSALSLAEADIRGLLHARGYSDDQIESWPGFMGVLGAQAMYWALVKGGGLAGDDAAWVDRLDQRESLATMSLEALACGPVGWGRILSESQFLKPDPAQETELSRRGLQREFKKW